MEYSSGAGVRRFLPAAIGAVIVVALIMLAYIAGYHAGRAAPRTHATVVRP